MHHKAFSQSYPDDADLERQSREQYDFPFNLATFSGALRFHYGLAIRHLQTIARMLREGRLPEFEYTDLEAAQLSVEAVSARVQRLAGKTLPRDERLRSALAAAFVQIDSTLADMIEARDAGPTAEEISADEDARQLDMKTRGTDLAAERSWS